MTDIGDVLALAQRILDRPAYADTDAAVALAAALTAATDRLAALQAEKDAAEARCGDLAAALADILAQGVSLDDPRLRYVDVQIPRDVLTDAREVIASTPTQAAERWRAMEAVCEAARRWWVGSGSEREVSAALSRLDAAGDATP